MEIKVVNNINLPGVNVAVDTTESNIVTITVDAYTKRLGDVASGEVIKIGDYEYSVLEHTDIGTVVVTHDNIKNIAFGADGDYRTSIVRAFCNGEFYDKLAKAVGEKNIIKHTVDLTADNGTGTDVTCEDFVSILTADNYRRYRKFLPPTGKSFWTATRVDVDNPDYARGVRCVGSDGILRWNGCLCDYGVRPFCVLNSSFSIS